MKHSISHCILCVGEILSRAMCPKDTHRANGSKIWGLHYISRGCCNNAPQTGWLKISTCSFSSPFWKPEVQRRWPVTLPLEALSSSPVSGGLWPSWAGDSIALVSVSVSTCHSPCVRACACVFYLFMRTPVTRLGPI